MSEDEAGVGLTIAVLLIYGLAVWACLVAKEWIRGE